MTDFEQAKELFETGRYSCVLFRDGTAYTSTEKGVAPLVGWLTDHIDIRGFSAADKIVGKAAALLFVLGGLKEVYAPVMSEAALDVFSRHRIHAEYQTLVQGIMNRSGTGPCPMERAVSNLENPEEALEAIRQKLKVLQPEKKAGAAEECC